MKTRLTLLLATAAAAVSLAAEARGEVVVEWWGKAVYCRHKDVTINLSKYGKEGMINPEKGKLPVEGIHALAFDLSGIQPGTKVHHASLRIHAPVEKIRTDKRAYMSIGQGHWYHDPLRLYAEIPPWKPVEIYVVTALEGDKPVYDKTKPLVLEAPQFKSFNVTEAVQGWVSGKQPNHGFLVRQLDMWDWWPAMTVLEVRYEGKVTDPPPQAKDIKVSHRKGQTFITWTEIEKIIEKDEIRWKEFEDTFKEHAPRAGKFYRIYRHDQPITAANLRQAQVVDEIWPLSGYDARLHEHVTRGEDWMGLNPDVLVTRYVITEPPEGTLKPTGLHKQAPEWQGRQLPLHTGLYVHQPAKAGKAYYAVTACFNGVENTRDFSDANSLKQPVEETVAAGEPILYRALDQSKEYPPAVRETQFFVYWAAPPYANQPRRPIHIFVGLPGEKPAETLSVRYQIGDMYGSELIAGTHIHAWKPTGERIVTVGCDASFGSTGYWSSWNTLLSREQAKQEPYAERMYKQFETFLQKLPKRMPVVPLK